jgi:hypothetical protein
MEPERFDEDEPLVEGFSAGPWEWMRPPAGLRERIWASTRAAVASRVRRRRLLMGFGIAAAYAAGIVTVFLARSPVPTTADREAGPQTPLVEEPREVTSEPVYASAPFSPRLIDAATRADSSEERVALLRRAGDHYLSQRMEIEGALYCYERILAEDAAAMEPVPGDTWLLKYLKLARQTEAIYDDGEKSTDG